MPSLLLQSLTDFLVLVLCNVHIRSHPLNEHGEQITLIGEGNSDLTLWMERAWSPLCCHGIITVDHIIELCDEYNNCKKVQFYTENIFRDISFFVILHHFVSTVTSQVLLDASIKILNNSATKRAITIK